MFVEIVLISISVIVLLFLIIVRKFNLVYSKADSQFLVTTDRKILLFKKNIFVFYKNMQNEVSDFIKDFPHFSLNLINKIFYILYKKTKKLVDLIKGNKIPGSKGSVSIYLKRIEKED